MHFKFGPLIVAGNVFKLGPIKRAGDTLAIGRLVITAQRFPWQGYGWAPHKKPVDQRAFRAPLNSSGARFGGGWKYKLGVSVGGTTVMVDLLFGLLSFSIEKKEVAE